MSKFRISMAGVAIVGLISLPGCGGGDRAPAQPFTTQIYSDPADDGDIGQTAPNSFVVTQGMSGSIQSVYAGIDPNSGAEYRAFLNFPLTGSTGIPSSARIDSARLELFLDDLQPRAGQLPLRIDLISFQPPTLTGSEFDTQLQPALVTLHVSPDFTNADIGIFTTIDVTPLMEEAQREGLVDFQIRVMEELGPAIYALAQIDDSTGPNRSSVAPLLTVTYE